MRQLILTILIISNLGVGLEIVTDFDDAWAKASVSSSVDGLQSSLSDSGEQTAQDVDCDHCCHAAAHFAGTIASCLVTPYVRAASDAIFYGTSYQFTGRSPPTPPPNV